MQLNRILKQKLKKVFSRKEMIERDARSSSKEKGNMKQTSWEKVQKRKYSLSEGYHRKKEARLKKILSDIFKENISVSRLEPFLSRYHQTSRQRYLMSLSGSTITSEQPSEKRRRISARKRTPIISHNRAWLLLSLFSLFMKVFSVVFSFAGSIVRIIDTRISYAIGHIGS